MGIRKWGHGVSLCAIMVAAPIGLTMSFPAQAAREAGYDFNIPKGDLTSVILAIGRVSGRTIMFEPAILDGRTSGPIVGRKTVIFAIQQAIAGTKLRLVTGLGGELTLKDRSEAGAKGGVTDIADIDVSGGSSTLHDDGFQAGDAGVSSRLGNTPAKEVPLAISSVTNEVLKSEGITSVDDALQNVAGVSVAPAGFGSPTYTIRGFQSSDGIGVDGDGSNTYNDGIPIDDVERVDVLKGPTSILTGATADGGVVNIVTKKPTETTIRDAIVRFGSNGYKTLAFDLGGIVPQTEGLTYRLVTSGNTADKSYGGGKHPHEYLVAPSIQWKDKDTSVLFGFRYTDTTTRMPTSTYALSGTHLTDPIVRLPRGVSLFNPYEGGKVKSMSVFSDISHDFGKLYGINFTFNNHLQYTRDAGTFLSFNRYGTQTSTTTNYILPTYDNFGFERFSEKADVALEYNGGFFKQTSKFGFDIARFKALQNVQLSKPVTETLETINTLPASYSSFIREYEQAYSTIAGFYYLEKFDTLDDRLHILGSVRGDHSAQRSFYKYDIVYRSRTSSGSHNYSSEGRSWTAGAAFDVTPWATLYGNRSNGFYPVSGTNSATGETLPPQTRDLSEVGARFYLLDKRLTLTAAFYKLDQTNATVTDPSDPTGLTQIQVGGLASRGFEFEAQGRILPGWNVVASFADTHASYTDPGAYSATVVDTPQITASLWTTYQVQSGPFAGLMFGAGAHGNTSSYYDGYNASYNSVAYKIPGYVVEDAMIGYEHGPDSLMLKINNLSDKYFFYPAISSNLITVGQGRNFMLTAKHSF